MIIRHEKHTLGAVAFRARREREEWKRSRDVSLDQRMEVVVEFFKPTASLDSITTERLYDFVAALEKRKGRDGGPLTGKTINRYLAVISGVLDFGRDLGRTTNKPKIPWQVEEEGRLEYFTREAEEAVRAHLTAEEGSCVSALIATGLRATSFFTVALDQIDLSANDRAWVHLHPEQTKNGKAKSLPMPHDTARAWCALLKAGTMPKHDKLYRSLKGACAKLGLSKGLTVHSTRHTTGTRLAKKVPGALVQAFMDHADFRTTQKYIHLSREDLAAASLALEAA